MGSQLAASAVARPANVTAALALGRTGARLDALCKVHADLMECGFDNGGGVGGLKRPSADAVRLCLEWLVENRPRAGDGSYHLKHKVERWARVLTRPHVHVSNGAMIAALLLAGFAIERRGINALVRPLHEGTTNHATQVRRGESEHAGAK